MNTSSITIGAHTVAHIAPYFEELKRAASHLATGGEIVARGYFVPGEEEQARQIQVSYWQSRNALLELVTSLRDEDPDYQQHDPAAFLVAYAAAILLVDAARFMRENFHEMTVVRHKLDEPDEQFGIPARMYDSVQKSLTSPRHAWHLYHAIHYFKDHEAQLREVGRDPLLAPSVEVIDRLGHRLDVSLTTLAETRLRVRARRLGRRIGRDLVGRAVYGIQKLASSMMADVYVHQDHHPGLPTAIEQQLAVLLQPGDVLIVRKEYALTNYFLPGYWPHAALYLGDASALTKLGLREDPQVARRWHQIDEAQDGENRRVLESMKDGVRLRSIASPQASDSIVVIRPQLTASQIAQALARGISHEGKPYDFDFDFNRSDRLVCTEVVFRTFEGVGEMQLPLTRRAGRNTLAASDLVRLAAAGRSFDPVAVYAPHEDESLLQGEAARTVMLAKEGSQAP